MKWPVVAVLACAGCNQLLGLDSASQLPKSDGGGSGSGDAMFVAPACSVFDMSLALCLEFEDPGLATMLDSSGANHAVTAIGVMATPRTVPTASQAAQLTSTGRITVADGPDFNTQEFTLTAWIRREADVVGSDAFTIIDVRGRYAMLLEEPGNLACTTFDGSLVWYWRGAGAPTGLNEWTLVTCSVGNGQFCLGVFPNGLGPGTTSCSGFVEPIVTSDEDVGIGARVEGDGTVLQRFVGRLDSVRVIRRFLTPQQVCTNAGFQGC